MQHSELQHHVHSAFWHWAIPLCRCLCLALTTIVSHLGPLPHRRTPVPPHQGHLCARPALRPRGVPPLWPGLPRGRAWRQTRRTQRRALYLTANPNDLGTECYNPYDARYRIDRLLMYDKHRGGMGLAAAAVHLYPLLLRQAYARVAECDCPYAKGCPSCVQHLDCRNYNAVLCKAGAEVVLRHVLRQEREGARARGQPWPEGWYGQSQETHRKCTEGC